MPLPLEQRASLAAIEAERLSWLWPARIAAGHLTLIAVDPGEGKSLLALDIASRLSSLREMPDGYQPSEPAEVLLLPGEDSLEQTVIPRLIAAGADLQRVHIWPNDEDPPIFPDACALLQQTIEQTQARLVILDPFFAFLDHDIGSLNELMIRRALQPLAAVASLTGAAFVLNRHLSKTTAGKQASYRGLGSIAILAATRTAFLLAKDPDDASLRVLACTKNNLAAVPVALGFRIGTTANGSPRIDWIGPVDRTADDLVAVSRRRGVALQEAVLLLQTQLAQGPRNRETLMEHAKLAGLSLRTLERAKANLGVLSEQRREQGKNVGYWRLPPS